jgi:hypothetical protein
MQKSVLALSAAALLISFGAAQAAPVKHRTPQSATQPPVQEVDHHTPGQLKREHDRAIAAGDTANDPMDSSSSDNLNRQQLASAMGATPMTGDAQPGSTTMPANGTDATTTEPSGDTKGPDTNPQSTGTPASDAPAQPQ